MPCDIHTKRLKVILTALVVYEATFWSTSHKYGNGIFS